MEERILLATEKTSYGSLYGVYKLLKGFHQDIPRDASDDLSLSILNALKDCKEEIMDIENTLLRAHANKSEWNGLVRDFNQANYKLKQAGCDAQASINGQGGSYE
jgi:hypothetical protein